MEKGSAALDETLLRSEGRQALRYFFAALALPAQDLWVNLSPYENNRVAPDSLAQTELGKDLLGQDYVLKQLAASMTYPESEAGKAYWKDAGNIQAFNKIWITADKAQVYEGKSVPVEKNSDAKARIVVLNSAAPYAFEDDKNS